MKSIYLFLLSLYFLTTVNIIDAQTKTPALTVVGHWEGTITQDPQKEGDKRIDFQFSMDLVQKGTTVTGIAYVQYEKYNAKMSVEGKISKNLYFRFEEKKILQADIIPNSDWCVKKGELLLKSKEGGILMEGLWEGVTTLGNCKPGRIMLYKKPPRV